MYLQQPCAALHAVVAGPAPCAVPPGPRHRRPRPAPHPLQVGFPQQVFWQGMLALGQASVQVAAGLGLQVGPAEDAQLWDDFMAAGLRHERRLAAGPCQRGDGEALLPVLIVDAALLEAGTPQAAPHLRQALAETAELAALLLRCLEALPEAQAAAQLELAQAAAARSCANLACAQLELPGGPAAGQGEHSRRCSGCRAAWYCDEACSRADWKSAQALPSHKRVCKQLAEARQAARQQAAQQQQHAGSGRGSAGGPG